MRSASKKRRRQSARQIIIRVCSRQFADSCSSLPKPTSVARAANRHHCKNRPKHPKTLDFELLQEHIPIAFLRADVQKSGTRHLVLATDEQLKLLSKGQDVIRRRNIQGSQTSLHPAVLRACLREEGQAVETAASGVHSDVVTPQEGL